MLNYNQQKINRKARYTLSTGKDSCFTEQAIRENKQECSGRVKEITEGLFREMTGTDSAWNKAMWTHSCCQCVSQLKHAQNRKRWRMKDIIKHSSFLMIIIIKRNIYIYKWMKWSEVLKLFNFPADLDFILVDPPASPLQNILQILATFPCAITNHFPTISFTSNFNLT